MGIWLPLLHCYCFMLSIYHAYHNIFTESPSIMSALKTSSQAMLAMGAPMQAIGHHQLPQDLVDSPGRPAGRCNGVEFQQDFYLAKILASRVQ